MKKVSILIPCYNSESFVEETLRCCLNQTYSNIEIILVDDGSSDNSLDVVKKYTDDKVRIITQSNKGACSARNVAFKESTGDYIIYLDADDIISSEFVEKHVSRLEKTNGRSVSFCMWDRFYHSLNDAQFPYLQIYKNYEDAFQLLLDMWTDGSMLQTSCYMIPRQLVIESGGWNELILKNQDGEFFSRILMIAEKALFIPYAKVFYRTGDYLTVSKASSERKVESMLRTFILYRENSLKHEDSKRVRIALSINFTLFIYLYGNLYPQLYKCAKEEIERLGVGYRLKNEPYRVRVISKLIGFDNFMAIRKITHQR